MLKKLLNGEYSLAVTFWKFGVLGLLVVNLLIKLSGNLLSTKIKGMSVLHYYQNYFSFVKYDFWTLAFTLAYLTSLGWLLIYSYIFVKGVWRSSAEYDKSNWFRLLARVFALVLVLISIKANFTLPF